MNQTSKRAAIFSGAITAIIIGVFSLAYITANAANRFTFTGRGIITENKTTDGSLNITFTHISKSASSLVTNGPKTVKTNQAQILKPNDAGKMVKVNQGNLAVGEEVSITGTVKSDNSFTAKKVVVSPRLFKVKGKMLSINDETKVMTMMVGATNYKPEKYVEKVITIYYNTDTLFMHLGSTEKSKDVKANYQRIQVEGRVVNADTFEATRVYDPI